MQKTPTILNLVSLILTPLTQNIKSLTLSLVNSEEQILIEKECIVMCRNGEGKVPLGFKISFTSSQTQVFVRIVNNQIGQIGPFAVDLQLLAKTNSQSYKISNNLIVKLNIEHPNRKSIISPPKPPVLSSNEQFILQRQSFLRHFRQNHDKQQRAMLKTPQFHRQSPPKEQYQFRDKVQELLVKTRQLKVQQSIFEDKKIQRKIIPQEYSQRIYHRNMKFTEEKEYQKEEIERFQYPKTVIHQHYHLHNSVEQYSSPYKLLQQQKAEVQNIFCRTNDSFSISSQQQPQICSPRSLFNAKMPLRKPAH